MTAPPSSCPLTRDKAIEAYFMEHRAKLIDIAAFLDRIERSPAPGPAPAPGNTDRTDFRIEAFNRAIDILRDDQPQRARRVLELLSDHTAEPIDKAPMQGALGAAPLESGDQT